MSNSQKFRQTLECFLKNKSRSVLGSAYCDRHGIKYETYSHII